MKQFQPGRPCSAVIKAGKPQRCLPASFDFGRGPVVELRPTVGLISAGGGNQSPIAWGRKRSQAVVETGLDLRLISTETPLKMRGVFGAVLGLKRLLFLRFSDTILILRKQVAPNSR